MDFESMREGERFEAKRCAERLPDEFWPTYSSFANTFGGTIVLGLEERSDKKGFTIAGVKNPEAIVRELWDQVNNPQKVSVNLLSEGDVEIVDHDGKRIIVVTVPRAERRKRPVYIKGSINNGTYRRNGEGDYHCRMSEIAEMMRDSVDDPVDSVLCTRVLIRDLDGETLKSYRAAMSSRLPDHPWVKESDDEFLRLIGAAGVDESGILRPTIAGVLMFGRDYSIERELPKYMLDYLEYGESGSDWSDRITTDSGDWSGNLFQFYMRVINRLSLSSKRPFKLERMVRMDDSDLLNVYREAVLNSLIHADYNGSAGVRIELSSESLIVRNPGTFRIPLKLAQSGGHSDPRNPNLMKMFMLVGFSERAGSGLHRMNVLCGTMGLDRPSIVEGMEPPTVTVTINFKNESKELLAGGDVMSGILECMRRDGTMSIVEIAKVVGSSTSSVSRKIRMLKDEGKVVREGSRAGGRWKVLD